MCRQGVRTGRPRGFGRLLSYCSRRPRLGEGYPLDTADYLEHSGPDNLCAMGGGVGKPQLRGWTGTESSPASPSRPFSVAGADPQGHPAPLPGHCVAAPMQCHGHASQEPILRAAQDVLTVREADPQGHCTHLPRA